jgi:peptide deformylase
MAETLEKANGVGLAAPQVGVLRRVVLVIETNVPENEPEKLLELVNPEILETSGEQEGPEGCLSVPGVYCDVVRPKKIKVEYYDETLEKKVEEFDNFAARMIQHELSHLDGDLFTDHAAPIRKKMISSKLQNIQKGKVHPHYNSKLK